LTTAHKVTGLNEAARDFPGNTKPQSAFYPGTNFTRQSEDCCGALIRQPNDPYWTN
jgi:hypothetical protein